MAEYNVLKTSGWQGDTWKWDSEHESRKAAEQRAAEIHQPDARHPAYITAVVGKTHFCDRHEYCFVVDASRVPVREPHLCNRRAHVVYTPYNPEQE